MYAASQSALVSAHVERSYSSSGYESWDSLNLGLTLDFITMVPITERLQCIYNVRYRVLVFFSSLGVVWHGVLLKKVAE